jgi:hypothetical protein
MKDKNKHIIDYLNYYCAKENNTPFAVLLKGKWGCGKTFFVKNYIESQKCFKFLHISLYGLSNNGDIDEKIFEALHPVLSNPKVKLAAKALTGIVRLSTNVDLNNDGNNDGNITSESISSIDFKEFAKNSENKIIVFDDVERCDIEIGKLFGYINHLVEFLGQKVIIVANEEHFLDDEENNKYIKIKEKLVGNEFVINPNPTDAIKLFSNDIQNTNLIKHQKDIKKILHKVFTQSGYDNLRLTKQALSYFEYFIEKLPPEIQKNTELFEPLFYEFVVVFTEYKRGNIKASDFNGPFPQFFKNFDDKNNKHFLDKYEAPFPHWLACFDVKILGKILNGYNLDNKEFEGMILRLQELIGIEKESWQIIWHFRKCKDEDFFINLNDVRSKWNKKKYVDLTIILHIFGILLNFSKIGFVQREKKEILLQGKEYVDYLVKKGSLPKNLDNNSLVDRWDQVSFGLGYYSLGTEEWNELIKYIKTKAKELKKQNIIYKINNELLPILKGEKSIDYDLDLFMNFNFLQIDGNRESYFQYFDVTEFAKILVNRSTRFNDVLKRVFIQRYTHQEIKEDYVKHEQAFLISLKDELVKRIQKIENDFNNKVTPKTYILKSFIDQAITPFIILREDNQVEK